MTVDEVLEGQGFGTYQRCVLLVVGVIVYGQVALSIACHNVFLEPKLTASLGISRGEFSASAASFFVGFGLGAPLVAQVVDARGRRPTMLGVLLVILALGLALCLAPKVTLFWLSLQRFCLGVVFPATVSFTAVSEVSPSAWRAAVSALMNVTWSPFGVMLAGLCYLLREAPWRVEVFCVEVLPVTVALLAVWAFMLESPRWCAMAGGADKARPVLEEIGRINGAPLAPSVALRTAGDAALLRSTGAAAPGSSAAPLRDLLLSRKLRCLTLGLSFLWAAIALVYYGLTFLSGSLPGSMYVNYAALAAVEGIGYFLPQLTIDRAGFGRCRTLMLWNGFAGVTLLIMSIPGVPPSWHLLLAMCGRCGISACFVAIYAYTGEVFPTSCRATGMGACQLLARCGSALAPLVINISVTVTVRGLGTLGIIAMFVTMRMPETLGKKLKDTVEEYELEVLKGSSAAEQVSQ